MALENRRVMVTKAKLTRVADAIREASGSTDTYQLDDMPNAIRAIGGGGGGGTSGARVTVTTQVQAFHGKTVTLTDGTTTMRGTFNDQGVCVFDGVTMEGDLTASTIVEGEEYSTSVNVRYAYSTTLTDMPQIYGASWTRGTSPAWTRTDDAEGFTDPVPSINGAAGSSPFDTIYPWSEMTIVEDANAGTMVKIPKFYFKWTNTESILKLQISRKRIEGFNVCPACADRGDGSGERDYILVSRYNCSTTDYKSKTNTAPIDNVSMQETRNAVHLLGNDIWQYDILTHITIQMLYLVEYANWDSQAKIGVGCSTTYNIKDNNGQTDNMPYHTGTTGATLNDRGHVQYRNLEGLWSGVCYWLDGFFIAGYSSAHAYIAKNPASRADMSWDEEHGYFDTGIAVPTYTHGDGLITNMTASSRQGVEWFIGPTSAERNSSDYLRYICDYFCGPNNNFSIVYFSGGSYTSNNVGVSGFFLHGKVDGDVYVEGENQTKRINGVGARLIKLP